MHAHVFITWACLLLLLASPARAHSDRIIELKDGKLVGLPEEFQPAALDIGNGVLTIAGKKLEFSRFLKSVFAEPKQYDLKVTSSWYHDTETLPPYISFGITPKGRDYTYKVLVDMKKLVVLEVLLELKETKTSWRLVPIDPARWKD